MDAGLLGLALLVLFWGALLRWRAVRRVRLPPGPPRLPIIGNLHQISGHNQLGTFTEWGKKYGDLVYARLFTSDILVINSAEIAHELLDKRGAKYSGRPLLTFLCELGGFDYNPAFTANMDRWRRHRKWFQAGFQVKRRLDSYVPVQQRETRRLLADLLREPEAFLSHFKRFAAGIVLEIGYGRTVTSLDDEYIVQVDAAQEGIFLAGNPGSMFVDFLPILKYIPAWFPGAEWKRTAIRLRPGIDAMNLGSFREAVKAAKDGLAKPCFATTLLEAEVPPNTTVSPSEEKEMGGAVGTLYSAGTETTGSILSTWLLAMVRYPEVYKRAQEEIDNVVGPGRLPTLADREKLPYLECVLKEAYRWCPPVILSVPHLLVEDDVYDGYELPRGSVVVPNLWTMSRDDRIYDNPDEFIPERFMDLTPERMEMCDPSKFVFGHGRRICPGRFLGERSLWLAMASITANFDIGTTFNPVGGKVIPPPDFLSGFIRHPKPFVCSIQPRSEKCSELIRRSIQEDTMS